MKLIKITRKEDGDVAIASSRNELLEKIGLSQQRISVVMKRLATSGIANTNQHVIEIVEVPDDVILENV